jgi:hypothetical protein
VSTLARQSIDLGVVAAVDWCRLEAAGTCPAQVPQSFQRAFSPD